MPQVINTNVLSLNAQRNLSTSGSSLATALQRLSSGLRINSAKDDAAGLAIAERFTTQIRGLNQAARNANDGISLAQTGEGALAEITSNLQRIRELSVQAANSTNSASDRGAIDQEVQQRLAEIQRVASQTSFNGQKILDGSFGNAAFQVGANAGETISINLSTSTQTTDVGQIASTSSTDIGTLFGNGLTLANGDLTVDGTSVAAGNYTTAASLATAINTAYTTSGGSGTLAAVNGNEITFTNASNAAVALAGANNPLGVTTVAAAATAGAGLQLAAGDLTIDGTSVAAGTYSTPAALATAINTAYTTSGGSGTLATVNGNELTFSNSSNAAITLGGTANPLGITTVAAGVVSDPAGLQLANGDLTVNGTSVAAGTYSTAAALATAINTAYTTSGGSGTLAVVNGNEIDFTNTTNAAITLGGANNPLGVNSVGAAPGVTVGAGDFSIDGEDITGTFFDVQDVADAINNNANLTASTISASVVGGELRITNGSGGDITVAGTFGTTTLGIAATVVDGTSEDSTGAAAALATSTVASSTTVDAEVTAAAVVTPTTANSTGVNTAVTDPGVTTSGTATSTGVNSAVTAIGSTPLTLAASEFSLQVGSNTAVDLAGSYANGQALADAINAQVAGAFASFDSTSGQLALASGQALTIGGSRSGTGNNNLGFATANVAVDNGSLATASVGTVATANSTILRVDAALTSINTLRGALGAIQNRFESTITNLTTASENLTSSRSRIQDADFAAETASLTRAQILQQAGTAILAQANAVPQNVLSLLR
jgi:flagellin